MVEIINNLTLKEIIAIVIFAQGIIQFCFLYLNKYHIFEKNKEKDKEKLQKLETDIQNIKDNITTEQQQNLITLETLKIICRYYIVEECLRGIQLEQIESNKLQSVLDLYEVYKNLGGNSYAHEMIEKLKEVDVVE